ncbi:phosphotransferase enzyme family protein [Cellulomonas humilata]|uniref:Ser/Thr protein kinase RdoA (MazF antagonist) n=1 Tax=Cellulomonas humilata TaxID=144055 RepID=A0ABU0EIA6_9CELL|nr:phosphotransferase [Cellulomonas humilata]MDQ0374949.1 Ser/Thr protein kinase RdoA (MazF antagonist) [Cellulomonas humilata]
MLPLAEIARLDATVDPDWRSPVADQVAAAWGIAPGGARWRRSSATHVFVVPPDVDPRGVLYLRFVPASLRTVRDLDTPARLLSTWAAGHGGTVAPLPSSAGRLVETVPTVLGDMHATAVHAAPGDELQLANLTTTLAARWGAALARLHRDARPLTADEEPPVLDLAALERACVDDPAVLRAARAVLARADRAELPSGTLHGDFELDNLRWLDGNPVAFDADEARTGPYVQDIAAAVRDLVGDTPGQVEHPALLAAFLTGYRGVRPLAYDEVAELELHSAAVAVRLLVAIAHLEDDPAVDEGQWSVDLRASLLEHRQRLRARVLAATVAR